MPYMHIILGLSRVGVQVRRAWLRLQTEGKLPPEAAAVAARLLWRHGADDVG